MSKIKSSAITPKDLYMNRRNFLKLSAAAAVELPGIVKSPLSGQEPPTPYSKAISFNNFYEFGAGKSEPAVNARNFRTSPWTVSIEGLVKKPQKLDMNSIKALAPLEERIYSMRCVEAWSVVVPWIGYPLSVLLKRVEPEPNAKYVAFESYYDPKQMPWAKETQLSFPYREGLRLDEAMHPLTILCVGMYGEPLPPQEGAPVRLIIPWKYGFKSIKSLVKITLVDRQPPTSWTVADPAEYGFYANVNPNVPHPRWSQARERRLGSLSARPTVLFNGYGDQVAQLYSGMNLKKFF